MVKKQNKVSARLSVVLRKIANDHHLSQVAEDEGCSRADLKEALVALADKIEQETGVDIVTLAVDGAARGNPGPAGAGAALLDSQGRSLAEKTRYLGKATNNEAEYQALVMGLALALERDHPRILIQTDSELMAKQITGEYKIKEPRLKKYFTQAHALLEKFQKWEIKSVPRAENRLADRLSNIAIDKVAKEDL
ncbi:MAG: ribonuclease HI family protein [bacterium]|nr:ribonuclease HI family protein [bacterium]